MRIKSLALHGMTVLLLAACADGDSFTPLDDDVGSILAAKGGGKGPPDKGEDGGSWDGTQDIVYVESVSKGRKC